MKDIHSFEPFWNEWYLLRPLGHGSYGTVYLAQKESFGEKFYSAIKYIPLPAKDEQIDDLLSEGVISSPSEAKEYYSHMVNSLMTEINVNYRLKGHTNIVSYEEHQIIERSDSPGFDIFIKMELLTSLTDHMKSHPFTVSDVIQLGIDICKALSVLRREHIIHRDIKPANIFINDGGDYKLGDFGVARIMDKNISSMSVKGTFAYMAPEVARGMEGSYSVDLYSLGIVMYKLLNYNRAPFLPLPPAPVIYSENQEAQRKRLYGVAIPLPGMGPVELGRIIQKASAYRPEDRWNSPDDMRQALEDLYRTLPANILSEVVSNMDHAFAAGDGTAPSALGQPPVVNDRPEPKQEDWNESEETADQFISEDPAENNPNDTNDADDASDGNDEQGEETVFLPNGIPPIDSESTVYLPTDQRVYSGRMTSEPSQPPTFPKEARDAVRQMPAERPRQDAGPIKQEKTSKKINR